MFTNIFILDDTCVRCSTKNSFSLSEAVVAAIVGLFKLLPSEKKNFHTEWFHILSLE